MTNSKISASQLVILLFLSRAFNVLNYVPAFNGKIEGLAMLFGTIIAFFISVLILIPPLLLYHRFHGENIVDITFKKSKYLGYLLSFSIFLMSTITLVGTVVGFEFFMTNAIYEKASITVIILTICIACFVGALNGLEGLSRASTIVFVCFMLGTLFIGLGAIPDVDLLNIKPILESPVASSFTYAFDLIAQSPELYVFILLLPRINGNVNKSAFGFLFLSFLFIGITNFLILGVFSDFFTTQTFPYYALATIIEISIIQRLDAIHMTIWVFISFIRITLFIIIANIHLQSVVPNKIKKSGMLIIFVLTLAGSFMIGRQLNFLNIINNSVPLLVIIFVFVVPTILLLITKKEVANSNENEKKITVTTDHI